MESIDLWGLFTSAFISSTLFPGGSEVVLGVLATRHEHSFLQLLTVASLGNTLGALTTWMLGFLLAKRLPLDAKLSESRQRALTHVRRWGSPALLLSWLPVVGDPLCFAAGFLRLSLPLSLLFIALGKVARYAAILAALT
jgi:membrane protein YqaA with SNARE-associated domain